MSAGGHVRERSAGHFELKFDAGRDPATGRRKTRYVAFKGTKRQAKARLAELIAAANAGNDVAPSKLTVAGHVADRIAVWRASGRLTGKSAERYRELAKGQIGRIGGIGLQKLTTDDIERWHVGMRADGLSPRTIRDAHHVLTSALDDAMKHGQAVRNVARLQKPPRVPSEEVEIIDADQVDPMLAKLDGHPLRVAVIVALYTGMRRGEQLAAEWRDVDLDARTLRVERALEETRSGIVTKPPKTKAGRRTVTLPAVVVDALRDHRRQQLELACSSAPAGCLMMP